MRKRNKLYTANKWNKPMFALGMDRDHQNILDGMYQSTLNTSMNGNNTFRLSSAPAWYSTPQLSKPNTQMPVDWGNGVQRSQAVGNSAAMVDNFGKEADNNNPFKQFKSSNGNLGIAAQAGASLLNTSAGDKALDTFDPVYHLAGGRESAVGNGLSDAGKSVFKASAMSGNGFGMLAGAGLKVLGGLTNAAFGIKTDKDALNQANSGIDYYGNFRSDATDFDDVTGVQNTYGFNNPYKGGWFSKDKARRKNEELKKKFTQAESWANRSVENNIDNIADTQMDNLMANYAAFGGPLDSPSDNQGAIDYGFMSDYLTVKNKAATVKDKVSTNPFGNLPVTPLSTFALGGDMQTNSSDFGTGLSHIDAGGSHEENPYQGVQVGISRENGNPNLVEEGETIFDDYVFSKRIKVDDLTKKKFHLGKSTDISFADLSKRLEKESLERPNDPISNAGLTRQLHDLADEQERQKSEQQQREAQEMFDSLPPEQQQEIMQQMAQQEQAAQQQQMMEGQAQQVPQGVEEQPEQQDGQQMVDTQMQQQQPQMEQSMEGEPQMNACGGKINRFDKGGDMKKKIYKLLGLHTDSDFDKWAYDQKLDKITDWENITKNKAFVDALTGVNPALGDAISRGYDFGAYTPSKENKLTFDFKHGGWGSEDYSAWNGSEDAAWKEAVEKGLVKEGMNSEEVGKALMQTDSYKRGSDWLKASDANRLTYLQSILNSEDAPQAARDYAGKFVDKNGWLKDAKTDYQTIFEDPNGTGVRNTHPGTYWKTPNEILRDKQSKNMVINDDDSIEEIYGDVPKEWTNAGNYNWADDKSDYAYNYFKRPSSTVSNEVDKPDTQEYEPVHKPTWGRYAGLAGPLVGLGMQAMGIGKPDYSRLDASVEAASGAPALAHYKPIGNYLAYNPMDIWYEQNRLNANSRATDRAVLNNASPIGTKMAGLLANGYNNQIASGNLYRQALEYNDAQRQKVAEFNRGTDMYNADAFTKTSATNAELQNRNRQFKAQMAMDAARQRMAADAAWNQGIYGNVQGLFKGLSDWGKENAQHNMIADMAADGLFGTMSDKQNIGRGYLVRKKNKSAKGGKISRRRGLTF